MPLAYQIGTLKGEIADLTGYVVGSKTVTSTTRDKLLDKIGGDLIVTAGKTLKIGLMTKFSSSAAQILTLMYDDDGVGTNEVEVFVTQGAQNVLEIMPVYIEIPQNKYVTAKSGAGAITVGIFGIEE